MRTRWLGWMLLCVMGSAVPSGAAPLSCDLSALTRAERAAHQKYTRVLVEKALEQQPLEHGRRFRFASAQLVTIAQWVALERRCCPFFAFQIEVEPEAKGVTLSVTGPDGAVEFLEAEWEGDACP